MPASKTPPDRKKEIASVRESVTAQGRAWGTYFLKLVDEWRDADKQARMFTSGNELARIIGVDGATVSKWRKGERYASRDACVRVAQWSGHSVIEVCAAAGWNPIEDGGYQTVQALQDAVRAAPDWTDAEKQAINAKLDLTVNPQFMFHPAVISWAELIRTVYNQRIPKLAKAERVMVLIEMAQAEIARSALPTTDPSYIPHIIPNDRPADG